MEQHSSSPTPVVLGLDNVRLDLPVASIGNRVLAAFVDYLILAVVSAVVSITLVVLLASSGVTGGTTMAIVMGVLFLLNWGFFTVVEIAMAGQTWGKRALHLRVVTRDGGSPSVLALVVRNLLRAIDVIVGVFFIALDPRARRVGDLLAGTLVIREPGLRQESALSRVPRGWGSREVALVESFLDRCATLEQGRRQHLARRIIAWVERDDPRFLDGIERAADASITVRAAFRPEQL